MAVVVFLTAYSPYAYELPIRQSLLAVVRVCGVERKVVVVICRLDVEGRVDVGVI